MGGTFSWSRGEPRACKVRVGRQPREGIVLARIIGLKIPALSLLAGQQPCAVVLQGLLASAGSPHPMSAELRSAGIRVRLVEFAVLGLSVCPLVCKPFWPS